MNTLFFSSTDVAEAATLLQKGELIAFPTETVYGLGADAMNEAAVKKVYKVKGRPSDNPLIVHVSDFEMVRKYAAEIPVYAEKLVNAFWPGPLTLIFTSKPNVFSTSVTGGLTTVAFRMPDNQLTLELIKHAGTPIVGPSANTSGKPSPTSAEHVFHDLQGKIAGILDDGTTQIGVESTVLDITSEDGIPIILRPGAVTRRDIEKVIGQVNVDQHLLGEAEQPKAPGMKYKHYAPDVPVWIVEGNLDTWKSALKWAKTEGKKIGLFGNNELINELKNEVEASVSFGEDKVEFAAKSLFAGLRTLDERNIEIIFAQGFPEEGLGEAYMNRLKKAANQNKFEN